MKKALGLVLALVMVLGMAIPASAVGSPTATTEDLKPLLVSATSDEHKAYTAEEVDELPEEAQKTFVESKEKLEEAIPEGMVARYFFYFASNDTCDAVFNVEGHTVLVVMQYIDGKWVEMEFIINEDGTITVLNAVDGPMTFLVKNQ